MHSSVSATPPRRTWPSTRWHGCPRGSDRRVQLRALPELYLAAKLAFLPWNGCAVPGSSYSTGVQGKPGIDCQKVYTPAAEAERRAVERLKAQALQTASSSPSGSLQEQSATRTAPTAAAPSSPGGSAPDVAEAAVAAGSAAAVGDVGAAPPGEGIVDREALRSSLAEGLRERNMELVEAAWQTLE